MLPSRAHIHPHAPKGTQQTAVCFAPSPRSLGQVKERRGTAPPVHVLLAEPASNVKPLTPLHRESNQPGPHLRPR